MYNQILVKQSKRMVSEKEQLLNNGQNWCSHFILYSKVQLYMYLALILWQLVFGFANRIEFMSPPMI